MDAKLFDKFREIAYSMAGIDIKPGKEALVSARVQKRLRVLKIDSAWDYLDFLQNDVTGEELIHFLDAISTNFTSFFRESDHFDLLAESVKARLDKGQKRFRFWSAASSSGEEPYSMAMTIEEAMDGKSAEYRILATDISTRILARAQSGLYDPKTVGSIPKTLRIKHFEREGHVGKEDELFRVKPLLREKIVFKRLNLSAPPFPMTGPLDFVFCRNVMIYFDKRVRQNLISEIERLLAPGGYLVIGHTETLTGLKNGFKVIRPSVYRKN